jgi:hypothetical protein
MAAKLETDQATSTLQQVQQKSSEKRDFTNYQTFTGMNSEKLARGLGWFSVGLGMTELVSPKLIAKISGVSGRNTKLIRLYGLRELAAGIGILKGKRPAGALWSRVAGDALDLASLGVALTSPNSKRGRVAFATANVLAITVLDIVCAKQLSNGKEIAETVRKPVIDEQGTSQAEASQILREMRDEIFESNDEKLALALGSSPEHIQRMIAGNELIDGDLLMKARALREERSHQDESRTQE